MEKWRNTINICIAVVGLMLVAVCIAAAWFNRDDRVLSDLVVRNFPAIIGLPFAFLAAFIVVALFRQTDGEIEFTAIGIHLKGAAGPIVLWIVCFLSISDSISLLWQPAP